MAVLCRSVSQSVVLTAPSYHWVTLEGPSDEVDVVILVDICSTTHMRFAPANHTAAAFVSGSPLVTITSVAGGAIGVN
jgi:hypothetical protein